MLDPHTAHVGEGHAHRVARQRGDPRRRVSPWPGTTMLSSDDNGIRNGVPSVGTPTTARNGAGPPFTCRASIALGRRVHLLVGRRSRVAEGSSTRATRNAPIATTTSPATTPQTTPRRVRRERSARATRDGRTGSPEGTGRSPVESRLLDVALHTLGHQVADRTARAHARSHVGRARSRGQGRSSR